MAAYAGGDAAAFEQLYARHQAGLYRFVRRLLGSALRRRPTRCSRTPGCASSTRARAGSRRARPFAPGSSPLAHHRVIDLLRRSGREVSRRRLRGRDGDEPWQPEAAAWQHWPAPAGAAPQSEDLAFWRRAGEKLLRCLEQLPLPQRSAFLLHHDDGLALDEVAKALEVGFETAKTRLRYAMSKLRTCMGAYLEPIGGGGVR